MLVGRHAAGTKTKSFSSTRRYSRRGNTITVEVIDVGQLKHLGHKSSTKSRIKHSLGRYLRKRRNTPGFRRTRDPTQSRSVPPGYFGAQLFSNTLTIDILRLNNTPHRLIRQKRHNSVATTIFHTLSHLRNTCPTPPISIRWITQSGGF